MSTNKMDWSEPILDLAGKKKPSQSLIKLSTGGINSLKELVWLFPLRIQKAPSLSSFHTIAPDELFLGAGEVVSLNFTPAFGRRGKSNIQLFNATCMVKDKKSEKYLNLKWFNAYPNLKKQLESLKTISFMGKVSEYKGTYQIVNPKINPPITDNSNEMLIEYPTVNTVSGKHLQGIIQKISPETWIRHISVLPKEIERKLNLLNLNDALLTIHGKRLSSSDSIKRAKERLIYEEFFENQLKVLARKLKNKKLSAPILEVKKKEIQSFLEVFPYELTKDQQEVFNHIQTDLKSNKPMMRMVQGDVGCGKTSVAVLASMLVSANNYQTAFMCPTEALASQHYKTLSHMLGNKLSIELLLGSTKTKEKKEILQRLSSGDVDLVIGTHALIQDNVEFKSLALAIIDEQHKFGVAQRQKLVSKGDGVHTLIMTATPIPRSLQLAQYGDLDISTIRVMPGGRKGIQTRIVTPHTYEKYLSFLKTRMTLGEQIYVVVPAIEESETLVLNNVNEKFDIYKKYFPEHKIAILHGQLSADEKHHIMQEYANGKIEILISTTVIEVGINVVNSTVISIYNPERFGLSSLHQLRGRVGRGDKPGFCFLVTDEQTSKEAMNRIKIIEKSHDGFEIAEADLKNRGQGDLFGASQSGHVSNYKLANIIEHYQIFRQVSEDIEKLKLEHTEYINQVLLKLIDDAEVSSTI